MSLLIPQHTGLCILADTRSRRLNGQDTSYSSESVILKVAKLFENRKTPWTAVLGNHDSEKTTLTRYGQFVMMQALPYFVGQPGPLEVAGESVELLQFQYYKFDFDGRRGQLCFESAQCR